LNPIERVWKLTRRLRLHNRYFPTLELVIEEVEEQFALWERPNEALRKLHWRLGRQILKAPPSREFRQQKKTVMHHAP